MTINVIFDNGGGTTIIAEVNGKKFAHGYDTGAQAAEDYKEMLNPDCDFDDWEGNDPDAIMEYDAEQIRNGGYLWLDKDDIAAPTKRMTEWGHNAEAFFAAL